MYNIIIPIFLALLSYSFAVFASDSKSSDKFKERLIEEARDKKEFLSLFVDKLAVKPGVQISLEEISKYRHPVFKRIYRLPSAIANQKLGITQGHKIHLFNFEDTQHSEFIVGPVVDVLLFEKSDNEESSNVALVLSDKKEDLEKLSIIIKRERPTGFAYAGKNRVVTQFQNSSIYLDEVSKTDPLWKSNVVLRNPTELFYGVIYEHLLYIYSPPSSEEKNYFPAFRLKDGSFLGGLYALDLDSVNGKNFKSLQCI